MIRLSKWWMAVASMTARVMTNAAARVLTTTRALIVMLLASTSTLAAEVNPNPSTPPVSTLINAPETPPAKPINVPTASTEKALEVNPAQAIENKSDAPSEKTVDKPAPPVPHIALIIPLTSKAFGPVAEAIRQGFIAAANVDGKQAPAYKIYARDDEATSLGAQYRKAVQEGAVAVIGGVTRDGANLLVKEAGYIPTLALNAPTDTDLPDRFFYISLNLDAEARSVARVAVQDGLKNVAVIAGNTGLAKRIQESFEKEFTRLGGAVVERIAFGGELSETSKLKRALEKAKEKSQADFVFLAADVKAARTARPFIPVGMTVFATSHTLDARAGAVENLDLDSVRFLEMPWFVEKDHPAVMTYAKPAAPMPLDYERLYALGIDAWRVMQVILKSGKPRDIAPLDGVTGKLSLDGAQFVRTLTAVEMRDGMPEVRAKSE